MNGINRITIKPGLQVSVVLKKDQQSGKLTEGIVKDILTKSPAHPHGIKVCLESGQVGRVKGIIIGNQLATNLWYPPGVASKQSTCS